MLYLLIMKYYHGTKSQISEFNIPGTGKHGEGFYFTPDLNEAYYFARTLVGEGNPNQSPRIYTVNLSFSNLFNSMNPEHCQIVLNSNFDMMDCKDFGFFSGSTTRFKF